MALISNNQLWKRELVVDFIVHDENIYWHLVANYYSLNVPPFRHGSSSKEGVKPNLKYFDLRLIYIYIRVLYCVLKRRKT